MAERNRVTPTGEIVRTTLRGAWMGNRGCLHEGHEIVRPWRSRAWIACRLAYKDWRMPQWAAGRYTVLFFHDEAVALAAGHRPCALCRRDDYNRFLDAWERAHGARPRARDLDDRLHADRVDAGGQRTHRMAWAAVPDGAFVRAGAGPALVVGDAAVPWSAATGYSGRARRPARGEVDVLTPRATVAVLRAGYAPQAAIGPPPEPA